MVGIVIVAHGSLPDALLATAQMIVAEPLDAVAKVSISGEEKPEQIRTLLEQAVKQVDQGDGVLICTDMFGGTPSNIALSFLKDNEIDVISGVNLPVLVDMVYSRREKPFDELAAHLADVGRNSISLASQYLKGQF